MRSFKISVAVAFALLSVFAGPVNPGLEEGDKGWVLPKPNFSVEKGAGRNGSCGLVCTGTGNKVYQIAHLEIPFKTGQRQKVSVWIKNEGLTIGEPGFCVEYFGKKGEYMAGAGGALDPRQSKDPKDWRRHTAVIGPIRPGVHNVRLRVYISPGAVGRVVYDDVETEVVGLETQGMCYSNRSDDEAFDGDVRFMALSNFDTRAFDDADLEPVFEVVTEKGVEKLPADKYALGCAELKLPVARLKPGRQKVLFALRSRKENRVLDELSMSFTRLAAEPSGVARFDNRRRLIVDGKPVYPLLAYTGDWVMKDDRFFPALKKSPIRMVVNYVQRPNKEELDAFAKNGIRVFESLIYHWHKDYNYYKAINAREEEVAQTARTVCELRGHPALLGWYLFDEPGRDRFPRIRERYKLVRELDHGHACLTVINHGMLAHDAAATCDVLGLDCYPIPGKGTEKTLPGDLAKVSREVGLAHREMCGDKPLWLVPQAFPDMPERRFPTPHELRAMVWQGIASGAEGVLFYSLEQMLNASIRKTFDFDRHWKTVCDVAQEIKDRERFLISLEEPPAVAGVPKGAVARAWRCGRDVLYVICNTTHQPVRGEMTVGAVKVKVDLGGDDVALAVIR